MATDFESSRILRDIVERYIETQRGQDQPYSQAQLAKDLGISAAAASKYITGAVRPSRRFLNALLSKVYGDDKPTIEAKRAEILRLGRVLRKDQTMTFEQFQPRAAAFEFRPFLAANKEGFTRTVCQRLFDLANKQFEIDVVGRFLDMFALVANPQKPHTMVLHVSETIPRSASLYTFHTPVAAPLNILAPLEPLSGAKREDIRERFLKDRLVIQPFFAVREEIGHSYLREVLRISEDDLVPIDDFKPSVIATQIREMGVIDSQGRPRLFIGDEFLCLQVAQELNKQDGGGIRSDATAYGFLFPLGTLAVSRSDKFAEIPTYNYGLFSVPRQLENVIPLLTKSLNTLFDNERFFVALAYKQLADDLTKMVAECISALPDAGKRELEGLHRAADEHFQFPAQSPEFSQALASRVARQAMKLNTQLIDIDDDLNLRWRPILDLVRHRLLGPLPPEYRDLRFDQARVRCRVFPPFLGTDRDLETPKRQHEGPASPRPNTRIVTWGLFGPVLGQVADLINLEDTALLSESDKPDLPYDLTVGMFDIPRRAYDMHFFRFPISLRLNALLPPVVLDTAVAPLQKLFGTQAPLRRESLILDLQASLKNRGIVPIVLKYTAAHYLCWDWGQLPEFVAFDPHESSFNEQIESFINKFQSRLRAHEGSDPYPLIIADDLTCFRIKAGIEDTKVKLLFAPDETARTRYFHSIAITRSETDWWGIMQEMLPAAVAKSEAELVEQFHEIRRHLQPLAAKGCGDHKLADKWLAEVLCMDLAHSSDGWNEELLSRAWQPVLVKAFPKKKG